MAFVVGFAFPFVTHASIPTPAAATAAPGDNVLTLFSEPGLRGRHATYKASSLDVEHQGFTARSAASTGMWTLCEGAQVASRCQTVQGEARDLKLAPQIVRPGLNALALYEQPGLKGARIIYSFAADRPAPFHARSARTWGGPWALCDRSFKQCQTLDGEARNLDMVVSAVRPAADTAGPAAAPSLLPVAARPPRAKAHAQGPTPVAAHPKPPKPQAPVRSKLVHVASHSRPAHATPTPVRHIHAWRPGHGVRASLFTPVRERRVIHHNAFSRRPHEARPVRYERVFSRPAHARLVHEIADRPTRRVHATHRRLERRVRLAWGGGDPYLYRYAPAPDFRGPPPGW